MIVLRIVLGLWIFGFIVLVLIATSQTFFNRNLQDRVSWWLSSLALAAIWIIAAFSRGGRDSLRQRFFTDS
ncbi:MAG: hypothetical protein ACRETU_05515 [Steroidobacterales bacterium]